MCPCERSQSLFSSGEQPFFIYAVTSPANLSPSTSFSLLFSLSLSLSVSLSLPLVLSLPLSSSVSSFSLSSQHSLSSCWPVDRVLGKMKACVQGGLRGSETPFN